MKFNTAKKQKRKRTENFVYKAICRDALIEKGAEVPYTYIPWHWYAVSGHVCWPYFFLSKIFFFWQCIWMEAVRLVQPTSPAPALAPVPTVSVAN